MLAHTSLNQVVADQGQAKIAFDESPATPYTKTNVTTYHPHPPS
jgi:hypothetical protein